MARPNSRQLAMRDPAAAAMLGLIGANGANFGNEMDFGSDFSPMGYDGTLDDGFGAEFGDDWGAEFGDAEFGAAKKKAKSAGTPSAAQLMQMYNAIMKQNSYTEQRQRLLEPNRGSKLKIERYSFTLSTPITIGTPTAITLQGNPSVTIRPQRICTNVPGPNFVFLSLIQVANVVVTVVTGVEDENDYAANAVGTILDLPTLNTQTPARVTGTYEGFVPASYVIGATSNFCASFKGWANIVA